MFLYAHYILSSTLLVMLSCKYVVDGIFFEEDIFLLCSPSLITEFDLLLDDSLINKITNVKYCLLINQWINLIMQYYSKSKNKASINCVGIYQITL